MSSRRNRQEPLDELDWLVSDALHAMVRAVEPSPQVWLTIRAAAMAQPHRRGARVRSAFRVVTEHLLSWVVAGETNMALGSTVHRVRLAEVGVVSPRPVWWLDLNAGPFSSDWQTCVIMV